MTTNATSDDTLIRDSQLSGFSAFKERVGFCCCRLFKKSSTYDLSSASKDMNDQQEKASYINQAYQIERQARKDKLETIARTLPGGTQGIRTPTSVIQTPTRSFTRGITNGTPRSGITLAQTRPTTNPSTSKIAISTLNKPSPLATNKKTVDEASTGLFVLYIKIFKN